MDKNRQIISELQGFFKYNDASKAIKSITTVMDSLTIQAQTVGPCKNPNCKFTFVQVVKLLILFPFFSVKAAQYTTKRADDEAVNVRKDEMILKNTRQSSSTYFLIITEWFQQVSHDFRDVVRFLPRMFSGVSPVSFVAVPGRVLQTVLTCPVKKAPERNLSIPEIRFARTDPLQDLCWACPGKTCRICAGFARPPSLQAL